ncbi:MAG: NUDIX hydrolase [Candidatus Levybacteria bacterium CG10_big_fil_rev_8_21_14_0_10_35_13]|nr:MAG: NUDIX hydrolase [Candidatus Levybacteria bacterium CG10_big_fil_rev_8_21_14_0_10_35_13]
MKFEFSAGGIVYKYKKLNIKNKKRGVLILVAQHSGHKGWVFPKGRIGDHIENESKEETAEREVEEETGARGKIVKSLKPVVYWYEWEGDKIKKTVYYFLIEYISGDISKHDWEMENVEWLPIDKVEKRLTYPSDKKVWKEAKKLI